MKNFERCLFMGIWVEVFFIGLILFAPKDFTPMNFLYYTVPVGYMFLIYLISRNTDIVWNACFALSLLAFAIILSFSPAEAGYCCLALGLTVALFVCLESNAMLQSTLIIVILGLVATPQFACIYLAILCLWLFSSDGALKFRRIRHIFMVLRFILIPVALGSILLLSRVNGIVLMPMVYFVLLTWYKCFYKKVIV